MKYMATMLVVKDLEKSKKFYSELLNQEVIIDFGANVTLTGGFSLQSADTWKEFINSDGKEFVYKNKVFELYFEEENFDAFIDKLEKYDIEYVHPLVVCDWGQRGIRFYDPDHHIIEVGETLKSVLLRFMANGMTLEEAGSRMGMTNDYAKSLL